MMRRFFLYGLVIVLGAGPTLRADENVRLVQSRLKTGGFFSGEVNGVYNNDTAAAITRYQIRNGLQITGKLDAQTRYALGLTSDAPAVPIPKLGEDVWRYLRKSDQEHIKRLMAAETNSTERRKSPDTMPSTTTKSTAARPNAKTPPATTNVSPPDFDLERLRDYVGAFVLAGLDPQVGSEAEFFADRVDYFGEHGVTREKIRRDLQRYDNRWPERRFWLAGELEAHPVEDQVKVRFPLRYELRSGSRRSSGKVWKTLLLKKTGDGDLQIVAVNEHKAK